MLCRQSGRGEACETIAARISIAYTSVIVTALVVFDAGPVHEERFALRRRIDPAIRGTRASSSRYPVNLQAGERRSAMPMPSIRIVRGGSPSRRCPLIFLKDEHGVRVRLRRDGEIAHAEQPIRR
jgi:hypothetical protein